MTLHMKTENLILTPESPSRRRFLLAGGALLLSPAAALAGAQREETLADDVASVMRSSINNVNPPRLVFADPNEGERWLAAMSSRLARYVPDAAETPPPAGQHPIRKQPRGLEYPSDFGFDRSRERVPPIRHRGVARAG